MRLALSTLAVTLATWVMKASGPLALGNRQLPPAAHTLVSLMAPALLAGLIVVELGGASWSGLNWQQLLGVAVAGLSHVQAPMLLAVVCGAAATASLRLL